MKNIENKKNLCSDWFKLLRNQICDEIQGFVEEKIKFKKQKWNRTSNKKNNLGGGEMGILRGKIFEKAGVNISTVYGPIPDKLKGKIPGSNKAKRFCLFNYKNRYYIL